MFKIKELDRWEPGVGYAQVVWHHSLTHDSGTLEDFQSIKRYHTRKWGWRDIGYNIVIERVNGVIVAKWGRPLGMKGAHTSSNGRNSTAVGICFVGNYNEGHEEITEEHFKVAKEVVDVLQKRLGTLIHEPHNQHATYKTCPGSGFPFKEFVEYLRAAPTKYIDLDPSKWYYEACMRNAELGIMVGYEDQFRPGDNMTRAEVAQMNFNLLKYLGKL